MKNHVATFIALTTFFFASADENSLRTRFLKPENFVLEQAESRTEATPVEQEKLNKALWQAIVDKSDSAIILTLLSQGADYNAIAVLTTPLMWAVESRNPELVKMLLENGRSKHSINTKDRMIGWTALHRAMDGGTGVTPKTTYAIAELLLKHGANPMILTKSSETTFELAKTKEIKALLSKYVRRSHFLKKPE